MLKISNRLFFQSTQKLKQDYGDLHPKILELGLRLINESYNSSNQRCIAMLLALKHFIHDFHVSPTRSLNRELEGELDKIIAFWEECRPFNAGVEFAMRFVKMSVAALNTKQGAGKQKEKIYVKIDYLINERIIQADDTIKEKALSLFSQGQEEDVILTYGGVHLLQMIFQEAHDKKMNFRVIIADSGPEFEGRELVKRLSNSGIKVTYTLINGVSFIIDKVTKVFIGASSVLSNGAVIAKIGNSMLTAIAKRHQKPVVVFSETYKFSERVNLDPININEIGDPHALLSYTCVNAQKNREALKDWQTNKNLTIVNMKYDLTPAENISMVLCELGKIPAISVPVVVRESHKEIDEYVRDVDEGSDELLDD